MISAESRVSRLNHRITTAIQNNGVTVSNETHSDLNSLCSEITPIVEEKYGKTKRLSTNGSWIIITYDIIKILDKKLRNTSR